jgi:hypothetical protein
VSNRSLQLQAILFAVDKLTAQKDSDLSKRKKKELFLTNASLG